MADRTRVIAIKVDDQFSAQLKRFAAEMQAAEKGVENLAAAGQKSGGMKGFNEQLHYTLQNAQQIYTAFNQVFSTANQWAQMGLGAERSQIALRGLTDEADAYIDAIQRGTMGAVTQGEAAAQAYRLIKFGLADSAAEAEKFIHTMTIVAAINPQLGGTSEAINQIQLTLSNMSFMRLDQLGISAGQVRKRMAELKDETAGLSNEQAFQTAVMEQLDAQASATGDSILELSDAQDRFRARIRGFKEDIGKEIAEGFEGAATAAEGLYQVLINLDKFDWSGWVNETVNAFRLMDELGIMNLPDPNAPRSNQTKAQWEAEQQRLSDEASAWQAAQARRIENAWQQRQNPLFGLPPARQNQLITMAQSYAAAHPGSQYQGYEMYYDQTPITAPEYYSQWAPGTASQYGAGRMPSSALSSLQAPFFAGQQARIAGAFGMSEIQQQMEWIEKGKGGDIVAQFFSAIETGARGATSQIQAGTGALQDMVAEAESISFDSLAEKFGIDPANFDVDVFNEMKDALGEAGVETDVAAEAMRRYELATGMATGSSEVFAGQMDTLAQQLAEGKISAEEYVDSVTELSQADYSWVDRITGALIDQGDVDTAQRYIDTVVKYQDVLDQGRGYTSSAMYGEGAEMAGAAGAPGLAAPGMAPATPLGAMMMEYDALTQKFASAETDMSDPVSNAMEKNQKYFSGFEEDAIRNIDNVESAFLKLNGLSVNMNANVTYTFGPRPPAGPEGTPATGPIELPEVYGGASGKPGNLPEFQHGGAVRGRGMVDPGEYVVPVGGALVLRDPRGGWSQGGGGGNKEVIIVKAILKDREIAEAIAEYERRNNAET